MRRNRSLWQKLFGKLASRTRLARRQRQRAMFLEPLESRDLLTVVAVFPFVGDASEPDGEAAWKIQRSPVDSNPLAVNFVITSPPTNGASSSDYEPITVTSVTIPANESYVLLPMQVKDDNLWEETEGVSLTIQPGNYTIGEPGQITLGIIDDENFPIPLSSLNNNPTTCNCTCTCQQVSAATHRASGHTELKAQDQDLKHNSGAASGQVSIGVNAQFTQQAGSANKMRVKTKLNGIDATIAWYGSASLPNTDYQIEVPIDVDDISLGRDGYFRWDLELKEMYPSSPDLIRNANGAVKVVHYAGGEFGPGWLPSQVDRLKIQGSGDFVGALWIRGDYNAFWFQNVNGVYQREAGEFDFSTLTANQDGSFDLRKKTGETLHFVNTGGYHMLQTRTDRVGNVTTYTYVDADGADGADEISTITEPGGLVTTYNYTGNRVTSITDPFGRVTDLEYTGGNLTKIKEADPDDAGPLTRPETNFTYNGDNQIASMTDAEGNTTSYTYVQKLIRTITHPGGGVETFKVQFGRAMEDGIGAEFSPRPHYLTSNVYTEYKDELNHTWIYNFNRFGKALSVTNPQGKVTTYAINSENLVTEITEPDPDGDPDSTYPQVEPHTTFEYDAKQNLAAIHYPDGSDELWTYDSSFAQPTGYTNRRGKLTNFTVNASNGNITQITQVNQGGSNDSVWGFTYTTTDVKGLVLSVTDPLLHVTNYGRNGHGLITSITYAAGTADEAVEDFGYNAYDNLIWSEDGIDRRTDYTWDKLDRLTTITLADPDGGGPLVRPVYTYEYNKNNYLKKETDPLGHVTEYGYNGRLDVVQIKQPDPDGPGPQGIPTTTLAYDLHRRNTSVTDPLGRVTSFAYDTLDRTTSVTLPDPDGGGAQTSPVYAYTYDHIHRLTSLTDPLNNVTLLDNATWNRIAATLPDPDGGGPEGSATTVDIWDSEGNFIGHTDEISRTTGYTYDDLGRLSIISLPGDVLTQFGYDKSSNLTSVTNPRGYSTTYTYDARDRLVQMTEADPDGNGPLTSPITTYTYNDASELTSVTDPRGFVTTYGYDGMGRLVLVTEADPDGSGPQTAPMTIYQYDADSRLTKVIDAKGNATEYAYDALDRLITLTDADPDDGGPASSPVTSFTYDLVGNLLSLTDPLLFVTSYQYDDLDRLIQVTEPDPDSGGPGLAPITSYTYDKVNNLLSVTDPLGNTTSYLYNNRYFRTRMTQPTVAAGTPITDYQYDAAGQMLKRIDPLLRETSLVYDALGRITSVTRPDPDGGGGPLTAPVTAYGYDLNSNLTSVTDALSHVTAYEYDRLDRLTKTTRPDPDGGGPLASPITSYAYDPSSNLTSVTDPLSRVTTYAYDGLNRRTTVTQPDPDGGGPLTSPVTAFAYDPVGNVTGMTDPRGNVTSRLMDNLYRTTSITQADPDGGGGPLSSPVTSFTYDAVGQMLSMTDPMNRLTSYEYDGLRRKHEDHRARPRRRGTSRAAVYHLCLRCGR